MKNKKENTDFVNYGTYRAEEADILKHELEKHGIPVKVIYPGTNVGPEAAMKAYFPAYQLLIRACDFSTTEKIREQFNISSINTGEEMPLPKTYSWAKNGLSRFSLLGLLISYVGIIIISNLSEKFGFSSEEIVFYLIFAIFIFIFLWLGATIYNVITPRE